MNIDVQSADIGVGNLAGMGDGLEDGFGSVNAGDINFETLLKSPSSVLNRAVKNSLLLSMPQKTC